MKTKTLSSGATEKRRKEEKEKTGAMQFTSPFPLFSRALFLATLLPALMSPGYGAQAATESTNAAPAEVLRKSVFQDDLKSGKDPFYPKSIRRAEKAPATAAAVLTPIVQLTLKGISGQANRRLALINNQLFAVGETASVRINTGLIKVRCWEIHENSVVISIEGDPERKPLRLRAGL